MLEDDELLFFRRNCVGPLAGYSDFGMSSAEATSAASPATRATASAEFGDI
jgi:hypothetical protein